MNLLIFIVLVSIQTIFTKDLPKPTEYKSFDDALVRICQASRLIGPSFMTTLMLQKLSPEKAAEISAISKGEKMSSTISKKQAQDIHEVYTKYQGTLDYFNKNVPLPVDDKNNTN